MTVERSYRRGDHGPVVAEVRARLAGQGLLPGSDPVYADPDAAVFDDAVDVAVRTFQQRRGITVDGIVGQQTYRSLDEARWRLGDRILSFSLNRPMSGDDVAALQQRLLAMGFDCGRVDGIFGAETEQALREFQRNVGVPADGTAGPATFKALGQLTHTVVGGHPHALRDDETIHRAGPTLSGKVVIIDPGHGGSDRGASGHDLDEAGVVHDLASRIEGRLSATGGQAYLTRGQDGNPSQLDRAAFANAAEAELMISLHCDRQPSPRPNGVATYYYGSDRFGHFSSMGERFAGLVQREIVARTDLLDGRTHAKTWDLLRRTRMPTVRIELGYLSAPGDAARLADATFRDVVAEAIAVAVQRLYLPPDDDAETGRLRLPALTQA